VAGGLGAGNSNEADTGSGTGAIAGGLAGLFAVLGAVLALFLFKRRKRALEDVDELQEFPDAEGLDSASIGSDDQFVSEYGFSDHQPSAGEPGESDDSDGDFVAAEEPEDVVNGDDDGDASDGENLASEDGLDLGE
jgi:LPXTG-motif cell wall-anchored protein